MPEKAILGIKAYKRIFMLYLMVGLLLFGAVLVWLFAVVSFNA
ncbi:hypothetical protein [Bifidobacterium sp. B4142]|nr:hypothetical protein [Bifidobacterium sp. B4142]